MRTGRMEGEGNKKGKDGKESRMERTGGEGKENAW